MTGVLFASALILLIVAGLAVIVYSNAVVHTHRAYTHVVLAGVFVLIVEIVAVLAVADESMFAQGALLVANLLGIGAMFALAVRFRSQPHEQHDPGRSLYDWYRERRGFVAFGAMVIAAVIAFVVVQDIAENAKKGAESAEEVAKTSRAVNMQLEELAVANCRGINEIRLELRHQIRDEIRESKDPKQIAIILEALPNLTEERYFELIRSENRALREDIVALAPNACIQNIPDPLIARSG